MVVALQQRLADRRQTRAHGEARGTDQRDGGAEARGLNSSMAGNLRRTLKQQSVAALGKASQPLLGKPAAEQQSADSAGS